MKESELKKRERQIQEVKEELQKSESQQLRIKQLREKLSSRDQEIIELIKDSNRKKDIMEEMKKLLQNTQYREQLNQLDIGVRETKI